LSQLGTESIVLFFFFFFLFFFEEKSFGIRMRIEIDLRLQPKLDSIKIGSKICFIYIGFGSSFFGRTFLLNFKFQLGLDMLF
jgi:hypothetical protein